MEVKIRHSRFESFAFGLNPKADWSILKFVVQSEEYTLVHFSDHGEELASGRESLSPIKAFREVYAWPPFAVVSNRLRFHQFRQIVFFPVQILIPAIHLKNNE